MICAKKCGFVKNIYLNMFATMSLNKNDDYEVLEYWISGQVKSSREKERYVVNFWTHH